MKVIVSEMENSTVVKLEGEMMLGLEANDFHEAIVKSLEKNNKNVVVNLSEVKFISSWGIGILIYGYTTTINGGGTFKLASVPDSVKKTFSKVKIDQFFQMFDNVEDAVRN